MKRFTRTATAVFAASALALTACDDAGDTMEDVGDDVGETMDDMGDEVEETVDDMGDDDEDA